MRHTKLMIVKDEKQYRSAGAELVRPLAAVGRIAHLGRLNDPAWATIDSEHQRKKARLDLLLLDRSPKKCLYSIT